MTRTSTRPSWRSSRPRRAGGLWNLFLPNETWGAGLSNVDYAPLCELMGRNLLTAEATNCAAPDTGNMELLAEFGTPSNRRSGWSRCSTARSDRASR